MKSKHSAIAIIAASILTLSALYTVGTIYSVIQTFSMSRLLFENASYYRNYYGMNLVQNVIMLVGLIFIIIALYARNRKHMGAIGYTILTVASVLNACAIIYLISKTPYSSLNSKSLTCFSVAIMIIPYAFSMLQLWILAAKPGQLKGFRYCWMLGPILFTFYQFVNTMTQMSFQRLSFTVISLLFSFLYIVGYFLAMLWLAFANADSVQPVQPVQQVYYGEGM